MGAAFTTADEKWMRRALDLAARGQGSVEPNPMVGCVVVRGGRVIGEGYHRRFGGPHAEVEALRRCGGRARHADVYVTLEPCCHFGKTGPCTEALLAAGVRRVVAAMPDPFPQVSGRGLCTLRRAGVRVAVGLCRREAEKLNAPYLKLRRSGQPWVILKWAQSLDGRIATRTGDSRWISGARSRRCVHDLRGRVDAVVVGIGTVFADDPLLTCRSGRIRRTAVRVILDSRLRIPLRSRLLQTARRWPVLVATTHEAARHQRLRAKRITAAGAEILAVRSHGGRVDLKALLAGFGRREMTNVLVEGGSEVLGAFADRRLADEAWVFVAPRLIGGRAAPGALGGSGPATMADAPVVAVTSCDSVGKDRLYRFRWPSHGR